MKKILGNIWIVSATGLVMTLLSAWYSWKLHDWQWFGRSGSILTLCGVILSVRPLIRMGLSKLIEYQATIDCGSFQPTLEELQTINEANLDSKASQYGAIMATIGTVTWGYGDLIGKLF